MENNAILKQIKDEYSLGYDYVLPLRDRYRKRITKRSPQTKNKNKININMIAQHIDAKIAAKWSNDIEVKFISRQGWIGQEEAENLTAVAEFDKKQPSFQQIDYQIEQDSEFFGVGLENRIGFNNNTVENEYRAISPLSWIPDPLPTQTGQFDGQNYRFHGFTMMSNVLDMKKRYGVDKMNEYFQAQFNSDDEQTRNAYSTKNGTGPIVCDNNLKNFSIDIYTHYCIIDDKKWKFVTDMKFGTVFFKEELKAVTKEEKLDPSLIPRPVIPKFTDPQRNSAFGGSVCDKIEDKQNAVSTLMNLNVIKAKKEALGGDMLINSRLVTNQSILDEPTIDARNIYIDGEALGNNPIQNAMYELPQSQIKTDTFSMINSLQTEAGKDTRQDSMQMGVVPDKTMTKAEQQSVQGNANKEIALRVNIQSWFYKEHYFQRWRGYLENLKASQEKFVLLNGDFEWSGTALKKDEFVSRQMPYVMLGSKDDMNAITEKQKEYINVLYPQIVADQATPEVSKNIFKRLAHKINGLKSNIINSIVPYSASERKAKDFVSTVNLGRMPKTIFSNPNMDYFTLWLYMQKAEDGEIKDKILASLNRLLLDEGMEGQQALAQDQGMANSAANIMMSQQGGQSNDIISKGTETLDPNTI